MRYSKIRFLSEAEGGRACPPTGPRYSAVARFLRPGAEESEFWSVGLDFVGPPNESGVVNAWVRFLVNRAPRMLLDPGTRFHLIEGPKIVAECVILGN